MKLKKSILIIGDLGHLKAYQVVDAVAISDHESTQVSHKKHKGAEKESISLKLIDEIDYILPRKKEKELESDQMGRFASVIGASTPEEHNMQTERDLKTLELIAKDIKKTVERESPSVWYLAFSKDLHNKLENLLEEEIMLTLKKSLPLNLTKTPKDELLSHFK